MSRMRKTTALLAALGVAMSGPAVLPTAGLAASHQGKKTHKKHCIKFKTVKSKKGKKIRRCAKYSK